VVPRIPEELKAKAAKAALAKERKGEKKGKATIKVEEEKDEFDLMFNDKDLNT